MTKPIFWIKSPRAGRAQKVQKIAQKWGFGDFDKNLIHSYVLFYLNMNVLLVSWLFAKTSSLGKNWFLSRGSKTYRPIRIQISVDYNMKLIFCLRLPSIEATNLLRHFKWVGSGMPRHAQSYPKSWVSLISRMSWAITLVFGMWLGVHRSQKFV